jgi:hypothetical protein
MHETSISFHQGTLKYIPTHFEHTIYRAHTMSWRSSSLWPSSWTSSLLSLFLAGLSLVVAVSLAAGPSSTTPSRMLVSASSSSTNDNAADNNNNNQRRIRFACLGNSIQYFNDCPRLLERMFQAAGYTDVYQNSCLRGGASIVTLWHKGNGMHDKFNTTSAQTPDGSFDIGAPTVQSLLQQEDEDDNDDGDGGANKNKKNNNFDFVIINDHTQSPARHASRVATIQALTKDYLPLLAKTNATLVFLQTAAYRKAGVHGSSDLGDFHHYTKLLQDGYQTYQQELDQLLLNKEDHQQQPSSAATRIAPVGLAYSHLYQSDRDLWERLYHTDDFHPSPHGTLLQAYVLYMTMTQQEPPVTYDPTTWWQRARRMQPPMEEPLARPTQAEAEVLRKVAMEVYQSSIAARL